MRKTTKKLLVAAAGATIVTFACDRPILGNPKGPPDPDAAVDAGVGDAKPTPDAKPGVDAHLTEAAPK